MPLTRGTAARSTGLPTWVKSFKDFSGFMFGDMRRINGCVFCSY